MNKIEKIFDMWSDLEKTYEDIGQGKTRSEFMKSLVGYKSVGNHGMNFLLTKLSEFVKDVDSSDIMDKYTILTDTFKLLSNYLDSEGIPLEIDNLNAFLIQAVGLSKELLTEKDLADMYRKQTDDSYQIPYKDMIMKFGCVHNFVDYVKDKSNKKKMIPNHYVGIENIVDNFRLFRKGMVHSYIMSNQDTTDKFTLTCLKVLAVLLQTGKLGDIVCISSTDNIENSKIFGVSMEFIERIDFNGLCVLKFKLGETPIYCLC